MSVCPLVGSYETITHGAIGHFTIQGTHQPQHLTLVLSMFKLVQLGPHCTGLCFGGKKTFNHAKELYHREISIFDVCDEMDFSF